MAEVKKRIESIDVFRGLTILVMIFVNDVAGVRNIPGWMEHMPADADGMTFVDLVFPAFLFIVGMSVPLALGKRISRGDSKLSIIKHIASRTFALLALGFFMVNIGGLNPELTGMSKPVWTLLMFLAAILAWNVYPDDGKTLWKVLKGTGFGILIILAVIYRGGTPENPIWMGTKWWGILGLIGWAYLTVTMIYLFTNENKALLTGALAFLVFLFIGDKAGALDFLGVIKQTLLIGPHIGSHSVLTLSGVIVSLIFLNKDKEVTSRAKITQTLGLALFLFVIGYMLRPLYGISKIYATPSWALYSAAICTVLYILIYWLIDVAGIKGWAKILKPAGSNPLLAYILPSIILAVFRIFGITILSDYFGEGITGIIRSVLFSFIIVGITDLLTRLRVRLQL